MYSIVLFLKENKAGVPSSWIQKDNTCFWPRDNITKVNKLIMACAASDSTFAKYSCRVLGKAETFQQMNQKVELAQERSDIETRTEHRVSKKINMPVQLGDNDTEGSDTLASPPPPPASASGFLAGKTIM